MTTTSIDSDIDNILQGAALCMQLAERIDVACDEATGRVVRLEKKVLRDTAHMIRLAGAMIDNLSYIAEALAMVAPKKRSWLHEQIYHILRTRTKFKKN